VSQEQIVQIGGGLGGKVFRAVKERDDVLLRELTL
jgi:hypothetical protein